MSWQASQFVLLLLLFYYVIADSVSYSSLTDLRFTLSYPPVNVLNVHFFVFCSVL